MIDGQAGQMDGVAVTGRHKQKKNAVRYGD
jgi:hypothetical protein